MSGRRALAALLFVAAGFACTETPESPSSDDGASGSSSGAVAGTNAAGASGSSSGGASSGASPGGGANATGGLNPTGGTGAVSGAGTSSGASAGADAGGTSAGGGVAGASGSDTGGGTSGAGTNGGAPAGGAGRGGAGVGGANGGAGRGGGAGNAGAGGSSGAPFKGIANSPCNVRTALGVSWYYNWTQTGDSCAAGGEFVPMIWGHTGAEQTANGIQSAVATFVSRGQRNVLAFNEPDNPSQSNIPVATAISLWPSFDNAAIRVGSPGTAANANPGQAWFTNFMTELNASASLRADFLAIHWYGWNAGSCNATASEFESYIRWAENFAGNRPIWITEWGCLNQSAPSTATVVTFFQGAIAMFARHPRIVRYAWYPFSTNCEVANGDGSLTDLGRAYAAAPASK